MEKKKMADTNSFDLTPHIFLCVHLYICIGIIKGFLHTEAELTLCSLGDHLCSRFLGSGSHAKTAVSARAVSPYYYHAKTAVSARDSHFMY